MIDLSKFAIFDESQVPERDPNDQRKLFPTPRSFIEQYEQSGVTDIESLGKAYSSAYKDYAKDIGLPKIEREANAKVIQSQFFDGQADPQSFYQNYQRLTMAANDPQQTDNARLVEKDKETDGMFSSFVHGVGGAIGGTVSGISDIGHSLDTKLGTLGRFRGDILPSYLEPEEVQFLQKRFPAMMGLEGDVITAVGEGIKDFAKTDNPSAIPAAIGSATGTLLTTAAGGLAGLGAKGAVALGIAQSTTQLANEGKEDYLQEMRQQGFELNPEQLANTTLLNSALASADLFPGGRLAKSMGLSGLDAATGGWIKKALIGAGSEGITEVAQTIASNWIARGIVEYDKDRDLWQGTGDAAVGGASAGAFMNAIVHMIGGRRARGISDTDGSPETLPEDSPETTQEPSSTPSHNPLGEYAKQRAGREVESVNQEISQAAHPDTGTHLGDLIASGEGGYGSFNRGVAGDAGGAEIDFSDMTVAELMQKQALPEGDENRIFAFGKYQIVPDTMREAVAALKIDPNAKVTPELQERIFSSFLLRGKRPDIEGYITGRHDDLERAQIAGAREWASIARPDTGKSHYDGDASGNAASISAERFGEGLQAARKAYQEAVASGKSQQEAWAAAIGAPVQQPAVTVDNDSITIRINQGYQDTSTGTADQSSLDDEVVTADDLIDAPIQQSEQRSRFAEIFDANNDTYPVEYDIVDAGDIEATVDKADNQYRDRTRSALQEQVDNIANDLKYGLVNTHHSTFEQGAPVLTNDGKLVAGNGRMLGIQKAYESGKAENYRDSLLDDAEGLGFDPAVIEQMDKPVLIRRLQEDVDTERLAILSNEGGSARMSPLEQARVDAERIQSLHDFSPDDTGDIDFNSARGLFQRLIRNTPQNQHNELQSADGGISQKGQQRIKNAILYMAYGDSEALNRMVESTDRDQVNVLKALTSAAPKLAEMRDSIKQGIIYDADITPALVDSVEIFSRIKKDPNNTVDSWLSQQDAFSDTPEEIKSLLKRLDSGTRRPNQLRDFLVNYTEKLKTYGNPRQQGVFGDNPVPTQTEVLDRAGEETDRQAKGTIRPTEAERAGRQIEKQPGSPQVDAGGDGRGGAVNEGRSGYSINEEVVASPNQLSLFYGNEKSKVPDTERSPDAGGRAIASRPQADRIVKQANSASLPGQFATKTKLIPGQKYKVARNRIDSAEDAAIVFDNLLGNRTREALDVIVVGKDGDILALQRMSTGTIDASNVYPGDIIRFVTSIPDAVSFYTGHNHPSGVEAFSTADHHITRQIAEYSENLSFEYSGMFAIGDSNYSFMKEADLDDVYPLPKPEKKHEVELLEHVIEERGRLLDKAVSNPDDALSVVNRVSEGRDGIVLMDNRHYPTAFIPVDFSKAKKLAGTKEANRILASVTRANAAAAIIKTSGEQEYALNVSALLDKADIRVLDVFQGSQSLKMSGVSTERHHSSLFNIRSLDQSIDSIAAESSLSALQEDALTDVFGSRPKNQKIIDRKLREYFQSRYTESSESPNVRAFVTEQMRQLRQSGALKKLSEAYFKNQLSFGLNDGIARHPIPAEKAEAAIRRVLGDIPFESTIPDTVRTQAGDAASRVKGAFANGKIYIDTRNIASVAEAEAIAVEELTHRGVANLFGKEYDQRLTDLYDAMGGEKGIRRFVNKHNIDMADDYFSQSPIAQMDELLAHIEANSDTLTVRVKRAFQRLIGLLRENIRRLNTRVLHNVSDSDIVLLARRARKAAQNPVMTPNQDPRFGIRPEKEAAKANERERIQQQFNRRYRPGAAERVGNYLSSTYKTTQDRYQKTKASLYNRESDFWSEFNRWKKRYLYADSTLGRDVADAKRGIDWKRAATHDSVISDVVLLESMIQNIYGKHRRDLSESEVEQFHRVITGQDQFAKPELQEQVAYFRDRIDETSQALIDEKYAEMKMRINELDDKGRVALGKIAQDLLDGKQDIPVPPSLSRIASLQSQINTIEGNKGQYLHRSYRAFTDPKWPKKARKLDAWNEAVQQLRDDRKTAIKNGIEDQITKQRKRITNIQDRVSKRKKLAKELVRDQKKLDFRNNKIKSLNATDTRNFDEAATKAHQRKLNDAIKERDYFDVSVQRLSKRISDIDNKRFTLDKAEVAKIKAANDRIKQLQAESKAVENGTHDDLLSEGEAEGRLNQWLENAADHNSMIEFASGQGTNEGILKHRKDIPEVLRQVLGEFKDPVYNYANTITQVSDYVAKQQYQMQLRQLLLSMDNIAFIGKAPEGMKVRQFPQTAAWSPLSDLYVDVNFMLDLEEFGITADISNPIMKKAIQLSAAVKIGKTALSPTTMMRNFWSGFMLLAGAGHSPFGGMADAYEVIRNAKNRVGTFSGNLELSKPEADALNQKYVRLGVRRDGATSGELADIFRDFQKSDNAIREKGIARKSFDAALAAYQFGDDFFKIIHFEKGYADLRKAGLSHAAAELEAARRTRDTMPTYSMVPKALQHLRQFPIAGTFVSFPFEVMRTLKNNINYIREDRKRYQETGNEQWRKMANKRILGLMVAYGLPTIASYLSMSLAGIDDEDNEALDHFSSDWRKGQLRLFLGGDSEDVSYIDLTSLVPSEYIMKALRIGLIKGGEQGVWSGIMNTGSEIGKPFYSFDIATKGVFNFFTNTDDNGYPIYGKGKSFSDLLTQPGENGQHWNEAVGYLVKQFGPGAIQNINDFNRALSGSVADAENDNGGSWIDAVLNERSASLGGKISRSGKEFNTGDAVAALAGFRVTKQNMVILGQQASQQTKNKINAYSSEFKRSVDVTTPLSAEYLDGCIQTLMADRQRAYEKMIDLAQYYRKKEKTPTEIAELLYVKNRTLGRDATRQIANGGMPPLKLSKELMSNSLRAANMIKDPTARFRAKQALIKRYRYIQQRVGELQR